MSLPLCWWSVSPVHCQVNELHPARYARREARPAGGWLALRAINRSSSDWGLRPIFQIQVGKQNYQDLQNKCSINNVDVYIRFFNWVRNYRRTVQHVKSEWMREWKSGRLREWLLSIDMKTNVFLKICPKNIEFDEKT